MKTKKTQRGFIVSIELIVLATILVLGLIVGMTDLRDAVLSELSDLSESVGALDQSYQIKGVQNSAGTANTAGSAWQDAEDTSDGVLQIDHSTMTPEGDSGFTGDVTYTPAVAGVQNESTGIAPLP